jgi:hypothetical protein
MHPMIYIPILPSLQIPRSPSDFFTSLLGSKPSYITLKIFCDEDDITLVKVGFPWVPFDLKGENALDVNNAYHVLIIDYLVIMHY